MTARNVPGMHAARTFLSALAVLALAGCASHTAPKAAPAPAVTTAAPSPSPSVQVAPAVAHDAHAVEACRQMAADVNVEVNVTPADDPKIRRAAEEGAKSANFTVSFDAKLLVDVLDERQAKGKPDWTELRVLEQTRVFEQTCDRNGLLKR